MFGKITFEGSHISLSADLLDLLDLRPSERICPIGRYFEPFNTTDLHRKVYKFIAIVTKSIPFEVKAKFGSFLHLGVVD